MSTGPTAPSGFLHSAWGVTWLLPFPFAELRRAPAGAAPEVAVLDGPVPPWPRSADGSLLRGPTTPREFRFNLPGTARILVREGREILVERHPGSTETNLRLLLLGTGAALVLHQRGALPLHASGIVGPKGAILFLGHSGTGKSTLVAEFLRRGYPMLAEDLAAVRLAPDGTAWVAPGVASARLWADSARTLGFSTEGLARVRPELEKFLLPVGPEQLASEAEPLHRVYSLSTHNRPEVELEELQEARKFNSLLEQTWMKMAVRRMGLEAEHFRRVVLLARRVGVVRVRRPQRGFRLAQLADALEADFQS